MARVLMVLLLAAVVCGCAPNVNVERVRAESTLLQDRKSVLTGHGLSERSQICLRLLDLEKSYTNEPVPTARAIFWRSRSDPGGLWRIAASEMMLGTAESYAGTVRDDASLFLASAYFAWEQLRYDLSVRDVALDGRTEFAADLYNRAVARFVSLTNEDWTDREEPVMYEGDGGTYRVTAIQGEGALEDDTLWDPNFFDWFKPTEEFQVEGMRNHHRFDGFGATLLAYAENDEERSASDPYKPPEGISYPATAVLRFDGDDPTGGGVSDVQLELFNTMTASRTVLERHAVPLSTDHTIPLAYVYGLSELGKVGTRGLTEVEDELDKLGVYMKQPYDPDRIPVLLVHGLRSSPITWRDVQNDLRADPVIQKRCQIWAFLYPTGLPFPTVAARLRASLNEVLEHWDPEGDDPGPREIIVIGHSMGGLIARGLVQDMGDDLISAVYDRTLDEMELSDETSELLEQVFYYDAHPDVKRVVFVASPLKGAELATNWLGRLGSSLVELPEALVRASKELSKYRPEEGWWHEGGKGSIPTSIQTLRPDAPALAVYNAKPIDVPHHTIIGIKDGGPPEEGSDGVVAYWSASVPSAQSELIVKSGHNAHNHPLAIQEMRRIIRLHIDEVDARRAVAP
ncbi:MAG: alpha/beta fold hydrolase [Planctomycetota bacterium]